MANVESNLQEFELLVLYKPVLALAEMAWCDALHIPPHKDQAAGLRFQAYHQYVLWQGISFRRSQRGP